MLGVVILMRYRGELGGRPLNAQAVESRARPILGDQAVPLAGANGHTPKVSAQRQRTLPGPASLMRCPPRSPRFGCLARLLLC